MKKISRKFSFMCFLDDGTKCPMFNTKDIQERYTKRNEDVTAAAVKIHALIDDCQKYYKADVSSETWKSYLQYIDELIVEGLLKVFLLCTNHMNRFFWKLETTYFFL